MAAKFEQYMVGMTLEGERKLAESDALREAIERYVDASEPEKFVPAGGRVLGIGKYSFAFLVEGIVLKVSSPTSSQLAFNTGKPTKPENLEDQFRVLSQLSSHLRRTDDGITTPDQFFVAHSPAGAYILGQQYLDGWVPLEHRANQIYGDRELTVDEVNEVEDTTAALRVRVVRSIARFSMRTSINDLGLHHPVGLHGGNVMVPGSEPLRPDTKAAIIDQPRAPR